MMMIVGIVAMTCSFLCALGAYMGRFDDFPLMKALPWIIMGLLNINAFLSSL